MGIIQEPNLQATIDRFLAARPFYPCLLLVHTDIMPLQQVSERLLSKYNWPALSIGAVLSETLLHVAPRHRPHEAQRTFIDAVRQLAPRPILCTDIDLLFEPTLDLDPLRLLRETSRVTPLIVTWPGSFTNKVLAYATAQPPHAHYRAWTKTELCDYCVVNL
jgi:hypothetical protein